MGTYTEHEQIQDRQRYEELYAPQLDSIIRHLKEQIRLRGYWVSREILKWAPDPVGSRVIGVARDPWRLHEARSDIVLRIEPAGFPLVDVSIFIVGPGEWADRKMVEVLTVSCRSEHPEVGRILAALDLREIVRRLTWHLADLSLPPSSKHWWPQKKAAGLGGVAVLDEAVPGAGRREQDRG